MLKKQNNKWYKLIVEFIKLQLAGNVLFWGTMGGTFLLNKIFGFAQFPSFVAASVVGNILYFGLDRHWVFADVYKHDRKPTGDIARFAIFSFVSFVINIVLVGALQKIVFDVYISQIIAGFFFTVWSYIGLKFWVFTPSSYRPSIYKPVKTKKRQ